MKKILLVGLILALTSASLTEEQRTKSCILFGRSYMAEDVPNVENFAADSGLNIDEFRITYSIKVIETCLASITEEQSLKLLDAIKDVYSIKLADYPEALQFRDYESLAKDFTFAEDARTRYTEINAITQGLNKEIQAEIRKNQSGGPAGIDLSEANSFTQAIYLAIVLGGVAVLFIIAIRMLFAPKPPSEWEIAREEKRRRKELKKKN